MAIDEWIDTSAFSDKSRVTFFKKTYGHLALAVLLLILVETILFRIDPVVKLALSLTGGWSWLLLLVGFMFVTNYAEQMSRTLHNPTKQYLALIIYVIAEAFIMIPLIYRAMRVSEHGTLDLINQAAILSLSLFTALSIIVLMTRKDFSFLRTALTIGFFIALGLIIAGLLFGFNLGLWFSVGMIVLASGSILYQTSNLVHRYHKQQHVSAALGLFASLMMLFWYVLRILSRD